MIISIVLFICIFASFLSFIVLLCTGLFPYIIIPIILFFILFLMLRMWFYHRCRMYIDLNRNIIEIHRFILGDDKQAGYIKFTSNKGVYSCENNGRCISFNLNGFLFKKSFIRAFVIRQIRYKTISNKLRISKLFSLKLKCGCRYENLFLVVDNHKYLILSNGVSKNTCISSEISKSKYSAMYSSMRTFIDSNVIEEVNEKIYLDYYKFY